MKSGLAAGARFAKENRFILVLFLVSTLFFLYEHSIGTAWDFSVYVLNAKYIFSHGNYFEWSRPPLAPFLIGVFSFAGWAAAEYFYIVFVSSLFFYATIKFADAYGLERRLFYALMLGPFVLIYGLWVGTELLSLSLLMLFAASLAKKEPSGTAFLSLAFLARYTNFVFVPLALIYRKPKKLVIAAAVFLLPIVAWLAYNYIQTGSMLTSFADQYALGIKYRDYIQQPVKAEDFLIVLNYLVPLSLAGIAAKRKIFDRHDALMLAFAALATYSFWMIPLREARYLFNLILPVAYFSYFFLKKYSWSRYTIISATLVLLLAAALMQPHPAIRAERETYLDAINNLDNCAVASNAWPLLNYYGRPAESAPYLLQLQDRINKGYRLVFFADAKEPEYAHNKTFMHSFPAILENEKYIIIGDKAKCAPQKKIINETYIEQLNEYVVNFKQKPAEESAPCKILLQPLENTSVCQAIR